MKSVNALELRQSLGRVLRQLETGGAPILVARGRTPVAALISLKDYRERFADREADERRRDVVARIRELRFELPAKSTSLDLLRNLRAGRV
jgi:prevent-host-death family protein